MKREIRRLADDSFDVVILGGGLFGLATAWACSLRGLRVGLVERGDFGDASSGGALKLGQAGLGALQDLNPRALRFLAAERRHLLRMAPHLVQPLRVIHPCYGSGMGCLAALRGIVTFSNLATWNRNHGVTDPSLRIPRAAF